MPINQTSWLEFVDMCELVWKIPGFCPRLVFKEMRAQFFCALQSLFLLPLCNQFRVAAQKDIRNAPAVEFCRSGIYGRRQKVVLEAVTQCRSFI